MKALNISFLALSLTLFSGASWAQEILEAPSVEAPSPPTQQGAEESSLPSIEEPDFPDTEESAPLQPIDQPETPQRLFWECQLPGGEFLIDLADIVTLSVHEYVIEGEAEVYEATLATRSSLVVRFYFRKNLPAPAPPPTPSFLAEGKLALERARSLIATGRHIRQPSVDDHGLPVKRAENISLAPTVEYRLQRKADVLALYQSASTAWIHGESGLFQLNEEGQQVHESSDE